jgi:hypothetical protein
MSASVWVIKRIEGRYMLYALCLPAPGRPRKAVWTSENAVMIGSKYQYSIDYEEGNPQMSVENTVPPRIDWRRLIRWMKIHQASPSLGNLVKDRLQHPSKKEGGELTKPERPVRSALEVIPTYPLSEHLCWYSLIKAALSCTPKSATLGDCRPLGALLVSSVNHCPCHCLTLL